MGHSLSTILQTDVIEVGYAITPNQFAITHGYS